MSFAKIKNFFRRLSVRLAIVFTGLFLVLSALALSILYFSLSELFLRNDRAVVETKWRQYAIAFKHGGVKELEKYLDDERKQPGDVPVYLQLLNLRGETIFLRFPQENVPSSAGEFFNSALPLEGWAEVQSPVDKMWMEVLARKFNDGFILRVGKYSQFGDELSSELLRIFAWVAFFSVTLGSLLGIYFSFKVLSPLRELISNIRQVSPGSPSSRVPVHPSGDEMEELSVILNQLLGRVEKLIYAMKETLDNVAHDIRTPMARLKAVAELQLKDAPDPNKLHSALEECAENADEIVTLLSSLMDLAEAESGSMRLQLREVKVGDLIQSVVDMYEIVAEEKGLTVKTAGSLETLVMVDSSRMKQAIGNLVDNAIKYSAPGGEVRIVVEVGTSVMIVVSDKGSGIDSADLPRIWDRLFRSDRSRSKRGLGIGLSLVKAIALAHGGDVSVQSERGKGSTFVLRLAKI